MGTIHRKRKGAWDWEGVEVRSYTKAGSEGSTKRVLIGPDDGAKSFAMRFFEVPPGLSSANEHHKEQHQVYIVTGEGEVLIGDSWHGFKPSDVVFIPGGEQHCFRNTGDGILRFICVSERAW